jgi:hypothetical protein
MQRNKTTFAAISEPCPLGVVKDVRERQFEIFSQGLFDHVENDG